MAYKRGKSAGRKARSLQSDKPAEKGGNRRLAVLADHLSDAVVVHRDGVVIYANEAALNLVCAKRRSDLVGAVIFDFLPPEQHAVSRDRIQVAMEDNRILRPMRMSLRRLDGESVPVEAASGPVEFEGALAVQTVMRDMTATVSLEKQLHAVLSAAERASNRRARMLVAASHDLRQPLNSAHLYLQLLKSRVEGEDVQELVHAIEDSCESVNRLISAIFDVSKLQAGSVSPTYSSVSLATILRRIHLRFLPRAEVKGLRLRVVASERIIRTDEGLLDRALSNLVANAVTYTNRGGVVLGVRQGRWQVRLEVWDTGPGIPKDIGEKIFDEFFQGQSDDAGNDQSVGMGLAIVRQIATLLGGTISFESRPGRGTVFRLDLPVKGRADAGTEAE